MGTDPPVTEPTPAPSTLRRLFEWLGGSRVQAVFPRAWTALLATLVVTWGITSLWLPYAWDHGCFGYMSDTILRGGMPYRDALDFKGPLTFYIFAALQLVFGRQMWAVRALDLALLAWAAAAGIRIASQFVSRRAATCTMLASIVAFASFGNWYTAQPDGWAALALVVAVSLLIAPQQTTAQVVMASALIGACTLFKPLYVLFIPLPVCALWPVRLDGAAIRKAAVGGAAALGGFLAPIAIAVAWFAARCALGDMVDVYVRFNLERNLDPGRLPWSRVLQLTWGVPTSLPILAVAVPGAALGAAYVTRARPRAGILMMLWAFLTLGAIAAQRKFFAHN
jgi:hypothetical protein